MLVRLIVVNVPDDAHLMKRSRHGAGEVGGRTALSFLAVGSGDSFPSRPSSINAEKSKTTVLELMYACKVAGIVVSRRRGRVGEAGVKKERLGCCRATPAPLISVVGCLASRHTPQHPEMHVQSRITANLSPRDLSKLAARFGHRLPLIRPSRMGHRGRTDPV